MPIKTLLVACVFAFLPALAFAKCLGDTRANTTASACGDKMVYDSATRSCVLMPTS